MNWLGSLANDFTVKHPHSKRPPSISGRREKARNMTGWVIDGTAFGFQALGLLHLSSPLTFVTALWWGHYCNHSLWTGKKKKKKNKKPEDEKEVTCDLPMATHIQFSSVQSLSRVRLFVTPWTAARQASLSITNSRSPPKPMSIESVKPSNHLILCRPLFLPPSMFPGIRAFSNESVLHIR